MGHAYSSFFVVRVRFGLASLASAALVSASASVAASALVSALAFESDPFARVRLGFSSVVPSVVSASAS